MMSENIEENSGEENSWEKNSEKNSGEENSWEKNRMKEKNGKDTTSLSWTF